MCILIFRGIVECLINDVYEFIFNRNVLILFSNLTKISAFYK